MRWRSFFAGLTIMAVTGLAANAQSRMYSAGSSDRPRATSNSASAGTSVTQNSNVNRPIFRVSARDREHDRDHDRDFHRGRFSGQGAGYYPYVYPPDDTTSYSDEQQQPTEQVAEPEAPAPTIFENRPGYTPPPIRSYQSSISPANQPANVDPTTGSEEGTSAATPQPTTILVFRDGHQLEIGNYAIVGDAIYNLAGDYKTHKILLADLDLDKTAKVNQERGYEFRLPRRPGS